MCEGKEEEKKMIEERMQEQYSTSSHSLLDDAFLISIGRIRKVAYLITHLLKGDRGAKSDAQRCEVDQIRLEDKRK